MMRHCLALILCIGLVAVASFGQPSKTAVLVADGEPYYECVPTDILVKFRAAASAVLISDLAAQIGGKVAQWSDALDYYRIEIPASVNTRDAVDFFRSLPEVEWANFNYVAHASFTPNDTYYPLQWHYPRINLPQAWDITRGNANIVVAVCDMGFQFAHTDWAGVQTVSPYDFVDGDNDPSTNVDDSHGEHVAGTIFAATNNNIGVAGIAPLCTLMPIRVLNDSGSGTIQNISNGILWATNHGAELLNLSLGFPVSGPPPDPGPPLSSAIATAAANGVVIFAASGNDGQPYVGYPARYDQCIAVGATAYNDVRVAYSNYGTGLDIVAPGGDLSEDLNSDGYGDGVLSTVRENGQWWYAFFQGTSMATPHACGVGALLMSHGLAGSQVRQALQETAVDLGPSGWDAQYGYGRINALGALQWQGGGGGETILLNEPFETFPLQGWQVLENDADGVGWQTLAGSSPDCGSSPHNGNNAVWHDDENFVGHQDDWLITPQITIPAGATAASLTFWQRNCYVPDYYEYHGLLYSVNGGNWTQAAEYSSQQLAWVQVSWDAAALIGSNVRFAWRYEGTYATEWFLDDVILSATVPGAASEPSAALPVSPRLLDPYPNPFNSAATITFELSVPTRVDLAIFNLLGERLAVLSDSRDYSAGTHSLSWNAGAQASGLYFVRMNIGQTVQTRKLLLIR